MSRIVMASLLAVSICVAATASVESEVKARGEEFAAAWNKHNAKGMASMWAPDGDLINPFGRMAKGRAQAEKLFQEDQSGPMRKSVYRNVASSVRTLTPDLAIGDWDVELSGIMSADNKVQPTMKAHVTTVFKKQGGQWWIVSARAFNYTPMPAPPAKAKK